MKKNKTWDGDGVLSISRGYATLQDMSGQELGRTASKGPLLVGSGMSVGGKLVEVESVISKEDFLAGRPFLGSVKHPPPKPKEINQTDSVTVKAQARYDEITEAQKETLRPTAATTTASKAAFKTPLLKDTVQQPKKGSNGFKAPLLSNTVQQPKKDSKVPIPRHDPNKENALVMKRPSSVPKGKEIVDVVVDPLLTKNLRDHQRVGVSVLYECVMGMKDHGGEGAILADEMGLGKTLQTVALLWTLLKQNPIYEEPPVIKKALIVCPATLVHHWRREIWKWVGKERIGVFIAENKKARITDFTKGRIYSAMVIGYEKLRMVQEELQRGDGIDIVIADEGHRLKTAQNKCALAIKSLKTERRIILSGTPIQNGLAEFYTMVDLVNPGLLKKYSTFRREFENPIVKSQQPGATAKDLEKGEARSEELASITSMFILRRTADILSQYLPAKTEYVLFCKPTEAQCSVYRAIIGSPTFNAALGSYNASLELINVLKKVCNNPSLLLKKGDRDEDKTKPELLEFIPQSLLKSTNTSGKLQVLDSLLHRIRTSTNDKVVLVSNYTSMLDVLGNLLTSQSYKYLRLDGTTPPNKRQEIVDSFNRSPPSKLFVFLLSAKAGGTGLNLIGASRLIMVDPDWNPATDLQAMARIHRDGQEKPCHIYRLITLGAIDERIYQRQVSKIGLADSIVDGKAAVSGFTREELRDLFSLDESDGCQTHKLLCCSCGGTGMPMAEPEEDIGSLRNDLATLSSGDEDIVRTEDGIEVIHLDGEDNSTACKGGAWKNAKDFDWKAEEADIRRKDSVGKAKMLSLMQYAHFDCSLIDAESSKDVVAGEVDADYEDDMPVADSLEGIIEDDILRSVLREEGGGIRFVFSKLSH